MALADHLPLAHIRVPVEATTKAGVIAELLGLLPVGEPALVQTLLRAIENRERELTTGIGRGVAVPHAWSELVGEHLCALGIAREPIEFESVDGLPCRVFFLCVFHPDQAAEHLRLLSEMAELLNDDSRRARLEASGSAEAAASVISGSPPGTAADSDDST